MVPNSTTAELDQRRGLQDQVYSCRKKKIIAAEVQSIPLAALHAVIPAPSIARAAESAQRWPRG